MADFKSVPLFGGAIAADLPSTFQDVSEIRQVPDNQEVYLDKDGFSSIVFDILERVECGKSDVQALEYHLRDIVGDDTGKEGVKVHGVAEARLGKMKDMPALTLLATSPPGEKMKGRKNEPDFVAILLLLIRLEKVGTDIVVAINVPHVVGEGGYVAGSVDVEKGKEGRLIEVGRRVRERVVDSFEVREWGLFGE